MERAYQTISHPSQLSALSLMPLFSAGPRFPIRIAATTADERKAEWEVGINKAYRGCGCGEASVGMLLGLFATGIWAGMQMANHGFSLSQLGIVLAGTVAGTVLGKAFGLSKAEGRLRRQIRLVQAQWQAEPIPSGEVSCG